MQWDYLYTISTCYQEFVVCAPASGQAEIKLIFVINMMINYDEVFYEVDQSS